MVFAELHGLTELGRVDEPCPLCVSAIWYAGIAKTVYAFTMKDCERIGIGSQELLDELAVPIEKRRHPSKRIFADEANALFAEWITAPNFGL